MERNIATELECGKKAIFSFNYPVTIVISFRSGSVIKTIVNANNNFEITPMEDVEDFRIIIDEREPLRIVE